MAPTSPGSIEGLVVDAAGRPIADITVMIKTSEGPHPDIAAVTDDAGTFGLDGLGAGRYVIAAFRDGHTSAEAEVTVQSGRPSHVRLELAT